MYAPEKVLVIKQDDIYTRGFLIHKSDQSAKLVQVKKALTSLSPGEMVEAVKLSFEGAYDRVAILADQERSFRDSLGLLSPWGVTKGIFLGSRETFIEEFHFGKRLGGQKLQMGLGTGMEKLLISGGVGYLSEWQAALGHPIDQSNQSDAMNMLGNYTLYPSLILDNPRDESVSLGILEFLLSQLSILSSFYPTARVDTGELALRSNNCLIVSGEFLGRFTNYGWVMLSIIDGLQLEGMWEIYLDTNEVVLSAGVIGYQDSLWLEQLGVLKLGTVLVLDQQYKWGTVLGKVEIDVGLSRNQSLNLRSGEIVRMPTEDQQIGIMEFELKPEVRINSYNENIQLSGGQLGLIVDVRGRPLPPVSAADDYRHYYPFWKKAMQ